MNRVVKTRWLLTTAASLALASASVGQYRVGTDGRALEANNRVGSDGYNQGYAAPSSITERNYIHNELITGNITGGSQFRGFVPYTSPDAFRGPLAGKTSDRFIAQSSGAPYGGIPQNNAQVTQPFFGASYGAPPPQGFVSQGPGLNTYVPAPTPSMSVKPGDLRLGQSLETPTTVLPQPGQLLLPGPVDPNTQTNTVITASPLYGVRQWNPYNSTGQQFLADNMGPQNTSTPYQRMDSTTLQRMRAEVLQQDSGVTPVQTGNTDLNDQTGTGDSSQNQANPQNLGDTAPKAFESPQNRSVSSNSAIRSNRPLTSSAVGGDLATGASVRRQPQPQTLMAPEQQSTQYAELRRRLQQNRMATATNDTTVQSTSKVKAAEEAAGGPGKGPGVLPGQQPGGGVMPLPGVPDNGTGTNDNTSPDRKGTSAIAVPAPGSMLPIAPAPGAPKAAPLQIHSLAEGIQAKGLSDLLKEGEDQMKQGHYSAAIDQFDMAERVAPNNPFTLLDRAFAELGQSYYGIAERHLRQALTAKPELLMGQYDLQALLGSDRLNFLWNDLKQNADRDEKEARPVFLLAFIAYNTGQERRAAAYLDLAEKRSGGKDDFYSLLRKHWSLPQDTDQVPQNK